MPIIITPGTTNPPAIPVQLVVGYSFPKVPVKTIRKWRQFNSGFTRASAENTQGDAVTYTVWNPDYIALVGPRTATPATFTVVGARYVPSGTYDDNAVASEGVLPDYYAEYFPLVPVPDYPGVSDIAGFFATSSFAHVTGRIRYVQSVRITCAGCADGATYEVKGNHAGDSTERLLTNLGSGVWGLDADIDGPVLSSIVSVDPPVATAPPSELKQEGTFSLYRNGVKYDQIFIDAGFTIQMLFSQVETWNPEVHGAVTGPELATIFLTLYGPTANITTVDPPPVPNLVQWARSSWATQGRVIPS